MNSYEDIKRLAAELDCRVVDLLALSSGNDPFFAGLPSRRAAGEWFAGLWETCGWETGSHLRRLHYSLLSQPSHVATKPGGLLYENTDDDWKFLGRASLAARYLKLIPGDALVDRRNSAPIVNTDDGTAPGNPVTRVYGESADLAYGIERHSPTAPFFLTDTFRARQDFVVELWVEKSTMNDVLVPLAARCGCNLVIGTGETSETLARQAVQRAAGDGRPVRIFYISDFDPAGRSMPVALARKVEFWLRDADLDLDIQISPILLLPSQCEEYRLPRTPIKESERRAAKFEQRFGVGATELDALEALHPGEFARIVKREVERFLDPTLSSRIHAVEFAYRLEVESVEADVCDRYDISEVQERYDAILDRCEQDIQELEAESREIWSWIAHDLKARTPIFDPADLPTPRAASPAETPPLFDSRRSELDQIDAYRAWQGKGGTQ